MVLALLVCFTCQTAWGWGQEGHSAVAEIAQRRLSPEARAAVLQVLGPTSMASAANWADDIKDERPETAAWHFVNIPLSATAYDKADQCKPTPAGDCIVEELRRLQVQLRCETNPLRSRESLKMAIHLVGDIHQPLHTIGDLRGGNQVDVVIYTKGFLCSKDCKVSPAATNLHSAWDSGLIQKISWNWGGLVDAIENGWLASPDAHSPNVDGGAPEQWAVETHRLAQEVWMLTPKNNVLDDDYFAKVAPVIERQLGIAGLRLARFLNDVYSNNRCP